MIAAAVALLLTRQAPPTYALIPRVALGQAWTVAVKVEGKLGPDSYSAEYTETHRVTRLDPGGGYETERTTGGFTIVQGSRVTGVDEGEPVTRRFDARGATTEYDAENETRGPFGDIVELATQWTPKTPVALGASWTPPMQDALNLPMLTWTLARRAVVKDGAELGLEGAGDGPEGVRVGATLWLDEARATLRRGEIRVTNAPTETGHDGELTIRLTVKDLPR